MQTTAKIDNLELELMLNMSVRMCDIFTNLSSHSIAVKQPFRRSAAYVLTHL
jgi:hypothetical protein